MGAALNLHLEHYEGPLDLLLDLIRKQKIDVRDIPIATITAQYLRFLEQAKELDIDLGAEFVFMAATLIHIKSRMLLPSDPALDPEGGKEDPRRELAERLMEHEKFKNAAQMLQQKRFIEENIWSNPQLKKFVASEEEPALAVSLFDLVQSFGQILERAKTRSVMEITPEEVSVADMVMHLRHMLKQARQDRPVRILPLLEQQRSRRAMIALFLAVLELVKIQAVALAQSELFGEIVLEKRENFDEVFQATDLLPPVEDDYQ